ncbi:MAG TPA: lysoplasmalogenase [Nocardioidaceae bacterium]|nr:lysoplasmalogenase [Nocardioidaceae bacterium]
MPRLSNRRIVATAGYLALAAADSYLAGRRGVGARRARHVTKPLLMPALATSTRMAVGEHNTGLTRGVRAAQLFSWGGDVALLGRGEPSFLAGVGSFFAAHLSYIGGFGSVKDSRAGVDAPGAKAGAATWVAAAPVMAVAAGRKDPVLRLPIAAYAAVLSTMFATSTMLDTELRASARRRILAGTSLFLLSDSLLGVQKFLRAEPSAALETAVMATYTTGQWLIAEGAVAASRAH